MDYLGTFNKTLKQWWHHKYLWIVGIIAAIFGGGGGSSFNFPSSSDSSSSKAAEKMDWSFLNNPGVMTAIIIVVIVVIVLSLVCFALGLYLRARADSALIQATKEIRESDAHIGFWSTWALGKFRLKTLIAQELIAGAPIYLGALLGLVVGVALLFTMRSRPDTLGAGFFLLFGFFALFICIAVIYSIVVSIASLFGKRISVLEDVAAIESLKQGFKFFTSHFSDVFVFWLVSLIASMVVAFVTFVITLFLVFLGLLVVIPMIFINPILAAVVGVVLLLGFSIFTVVLVGPTYTFSQMYWTNVYLELKKSKP